jgi:hypothetical protein
VWRSSAYTLQAAWWELSYLNFYQPACSKTLGSEMIRDIKALLGIPDSEIKLYSTAGNKKVKGGDRMEKIIIGFAVIRLVMLFIAVIQTARTQQE